MDVDAENRAPSAWPFKPSGNKTVASDMMSHTREPLCKQDLNISSVKGVATREAWDTPPPSSPTLDGRDAEHRGHRSSSVTAALPSSPPCSSEADLAGDITLPLPEHASHLLSGSPVKPSRERSSLGASHTATVLGQADDPSAGLRALTTEETRDGLTHALFGSFTHALMLGRSKPTGQPRPTAQASQEASFRAVTDGGSGIGSKPTQYVALPNSARHVSRQHAVVEWLPFSALPKRASTASHASPAGSFVVRILGQNGLIVDGKRRRDGYVLRLEPGKSVIDFFGFPVRFEAQGEAPRSPSVMSVKALEKQAKRARASFPGANGASPSKKKQKDTGVKARKSLGSSASQDAVSQLLKGPEPTHARYVKAATLARDAEIPPSPPSSSPPGYRHAELAKHSRSSPDAIGDNDRELGSASPSLGRSRVRDAMIGGIDLAQPVFAPRGLDSPSRQPQQGLDEKALQERLQKLMNEGEESVSEGEQDADTGFEAPAKAPTVQTSSHVGPASDAESDLTPPSSPAMSPQPTGKTSQVFKPRTLKPSHSAILMPPPKLPASAIHGSSGTAGPAASSVSQPELLRNLLRDQARACVSQLAPTYDLDGLLAGAIVFHRTATISASEAVRSVLASNQGLMRGEVGSVCPAGSTLARGEVVPGWGAQQLLTERTKLSPLAAAERWSSTARRAWTERLEMVLQSKPMFGRIQRAGKDASGNSLECWYYYDKDGDDDLERAANLGALVKPIRGALKTHKPIFWKKSRSAEEDAASAATMRTTVAAVAGGVQGQHGLLAGKHLHHDLGDSQIGPAILSAPSTLSASKDAATSCEAPAAQQPRLSVDERRIWEETQPEEREKTWDRVGDLDWTARSASPQSSSGPLSGSGKRKRKSSQQL
ncbi:unnamed protein product [Parajaminaea phylloscopi]